MNTIVATSLLLSFSLLSGCATGYKPASQGIDGGFEDVQLAPDIFRVNFTGNGYTRSNEAAEMALLRAADLAITHGFSHFVIIDGGYDEQQTTMTTPGTSYTTANVNAYGNVAYGSSYTTYNPGTSYLIRRPSVNNTVRMLHGRPEGVVAYDAALICRSIGEKYGASCGASQSNDVDNTPRPVNGLQDYLWGGKS